MRNMPDIFSITPCGRSSSLAKARDVPSADNPIVALDKHCVDGTIDTILSMDGTSQRY